MNELVYPRERTLGVITLVLGALIWLLLIVGTFGVALLLLLVGFIVYLFAQSAFIGHIKGNGVELSERQFPDLHAQFIACCDRLEMRNRPEAYILNGNGGLNAFATKFLGTEFVVLYSDVVDAMRQHTDGTRFYLGHELGHLRMKHLGGHLIRWPALWLPLLGAAYARAMESTCDRHGAACSSTPEGGARALAALSAGAERWQDIDVPAFVRQAEHSSGFWMSFHELTAGYPWLTKRVARVVDPAAAPAPRNTFAYIMALFVPYAGRGGSGLGILMLVWVVAVLAAVAVPAYAAYAAKAKLGAALVQSQAPLVALGMYFDTNKAVPESLESAGLPASLADGSQLALDAESMVLTVTTRANEQLVFTPQKDEEGKITWRCSGGPDTKPAHLPASCKA